MIYLGFKKIYEYREAWKQAEGNGSGVDSVLLEDLMSKTIHLHATKVFVVRWDHCPEPDTPLLGKPRMLSLCEIGGLKFKGEMWLHYHACGQ